MSFSQVLKILSEWVAHKVPARESRAIDLGQSDFAIADVRLATEIQRHIISIGVEVALAVDQ